MKVKKDNKFFSIFDTLSLSEKKEFSEFLRLSFIKKPRLTEAIIGIIQSGKDLHSFLESKYSERSMWNIYSELTKLVGQYLSLWEILSVEKEMHKLKRKQLDKRGLESILISEYKNDIRVLRSSEFSFSTLNDIHEAALKCLHQIIKKGLSNEFYEFNKLSSDHLILKSLFEIISFKVDETTRKEFYGDKSDLLNQNVFMFIDLDEILNLIKDKYPEYKDYFELIINLNKSISGQGNYSLFNTAKNYFLLNVNKFSKDYSSDVFLLLVNICNIFANRTKMNLNPVIFELLKSKIDNGLVDDLRNVKIGENHFRDYIYIALKENDDIWAEEFLSEYSSLLPRSIKDNNVNTALAFIYFHRKEYSKAVTNIKKLKRRFFINDLDFYTIQIFSAYDTGNFVDCHRLKVRFQEYVNESTQLPEMYKSGIYNFLKILTALINYKESGKKEVLLNLEYLIKNTDELLWRFWIMAKLEEIKLKN